MAQQNPQPDCELLGFDVQGNGDVILSLGDAEGYWHGVLLTAQVLAGIAEASAVSRKASS